MNSQAHPPSETQQLEDARTAMEQAILRIGELERMVDHYRKQYNALWDAARRVVESAARELNYSDDVLLVSTAALRELERCVSPTEAETGIAQSEETQEGVSL
jgi:hypothetical protein